MSEDSTYTAGKPSTDSGAKAAVSKSSFEATYQIERVIASGGMGVVLAAKHRHLGMRVAVKLLHDTSEAMRQRFLREAQLAATLDSPFIVRVRDYGFSENDQPYLVMDLLDGRTLKECTKAHALPAPEVLRIAIELTRALVTVHELGIVHRDIKPSNVLLCRGKDGFEHVKLIDFGIAKRQEGDSTDNPRKDLTHTNEVLGTTGYMAPEQMVESKDVDQRADIFSMGAVIYEMLTTKPALSHSTRAYELAMGNLGDHEKITPIDALVSDVPPELEALVMRCLCIHPGQRHPTSRALLEDLETLAAHHPTDAPSHPPADTAIGPSPLSKAHSISPPTQTSMSAVSSVTTRKPKSGLVWIAIVALSAIATVGFFFLSKSTSPTSEPSAPANAATTAPSPGPSALVSPAGTAAPTASTSSAATASASASSAASSGPNARIGSGPKRTPATTATATPGGLRWNERY